MSNFGYSARVGIVVLIAIVVFGGLVYFLRGGLIGNESYTIHVLFDDASGTAKGVDVTMAGVTIGTVEYVGLTKSLRADLKLSIKKKYHIPVGSRFVIAVPALGDVGVVTVIPPPNSLGADSPSIAPGSYVEHGEQQADIASALSNANQLMGSFQTTVGKLNRLLDMSTAMIGNPQLQGGIRQTMRNVQIASRNGVVLTDEMGRALQADNAQLQQILNQTQGGERTALADMTATTRDVHQLADANRGNINEIVSNLRDTTAAVEGITSQTNALLRDGGVAKNMAAITANLNETTQRLDALAANLQTLSSDPKMTADLKATVHNLALTTEQTTYLVERVNHIIGVRERGAAPAVPSSTATPALSPAPMILPRLDMYDNARDHRFHADLDAFVPVGNAGGFAQAGIFGVGDTNRLDLEYGTLAPAGSSLDYRFGLHASKLGLGGDWGLGRRESISADLYDPNSGHLDVHGTLMLNQNVGLLVGGDDLTKRSSAIVGIELRNQK